MTQDQRNTSELGGCAAFVTGASRNIGRAIALEFARRGADVAIGARSLNDDARETAALVEAQGRRALVVDADLSDAAVAGNAIRRAGDMFGRLDILVNNAALRSDAAIEDISAADWHRITGSILGATFFTIQAALPFLRKSSMASIINIGGVVAHTGIAGRAHVAAAKAGVAGLTRAVAEELAESRITVNCIAPGRIETQRTGRVPQHFIDRPTPLGRGGTPEEVARLTAFLVGPDARYMTGQTVHLNGGWHMN